MEQVLAMGVLVLIAGWVLGVVRQHALAQAAAAAQAAETRRIDQQAAADRAFALERTRLQAAHPLGGLAWLPPDSKLSMTVPPLRESALPAVAPPLITDVPAPLFVVPSTRALLDQGVIAPGRPLVQGWLDSGPLLGTPEQTFTAAIGGKGRSGKTRTMALIIGQMVLQGARLLVIDPHRHKDDALTKLIAPLLPWCLLPPAQSVAEIQAVVERGEAEMTYRRTHAPPYPLVLLVIDEYTLLQRMGAQVEWGPKQTLASRTAALVESVATEGGGMNMKGLIGGQNWKGSRAGGTEVRQMLQSAWVHRSWAEQARYLVPDTALADQAESLVPGRAIFVPPDDDPVLVGMPLTERADLERMAAMRQAMEAPGSDGSGERGRVIEGHFRPIDEPPAAPSRPSAAPSPPDLPASADGSAGKRERVRQLVKQGVKSSTIIAEVWGATGGRSYQQAADELTTILADLVS